MILKYSLRASVASLLLSCIAGPLASASEKDIVLVPHRAVYDLKLSQARGNRPLEAARGRILYDFSGSACEGYTLQFRQVSELDNGEGKTAVSDLRATTFEEGAGKDYRFVSQNYLNDRLVDSVDGRAQRGEGGLTVKLTKPEDKTFNLDAALIFPTEHMRRIIEAARAGKSLVETPVYDGSETGERVYNTLSVIGQPIPPDAKKPTDAAATQPSLAGLTRWPVTISYFDKAGQGGEQTPAYSISFELYENGISRALSLDYNDFVIAGEMTSLEVKDAKRCQ